MSHAAATAISALASPATSSASAATPRPKDNIDLYSEGDSVPIPYDSDTHAEIKALFGKDGFSFKDFLDIINPLQHLPVIGTLYRAVTGDKLEPGSRIIGGALFGGIGGFVTSLANAVIEDETGSDIGDKALALLTGGSTQGTAVAQRETPATAGAVPSTTTPATAGAKLALAAADPKKLPIHAGPPKLGNPAHVHAGNAAKAPPGTEDPTEALIRARAAVPALRQPLVAGLPNAVAHSPVRQPPREAPRPATPATSLALANEAPHPEPGSAATSSRAKSAIKTDGAAANISDANISDVVPRPPSRDIAAMMSNALDKYEALMKKRTGHSISAKF